MNTESLSWYALTTIPQKEFIVENILRNQLGMPAFVPLEWKVPRSSRRHRRPKDGTPAKPYPLLGSRYLFVGVGEALPMYALSDLWLITGVVSIAGKPVQFPIEAISYLMEISGTDVPWRAVQNPHKSFRSGDMVEINQGPFQGHTKTIQKIDGRFATIMFELLGKEQPIDILLDYLEAA